MKIQQYKMIFIEDNEFGNICKIGAFSLRAWRDNKTGSPMHHPGCYTIANALELCLYASQTSIFP